MEYLAVKIPLWVWHFLKFISFPAFFQECTQSFIDICLCKLSGNKLLISLFFFRRVNAWVTNYKSEENLQWFYMDLIQSWLKAVGVFLLILLEIVLERMRLKEKSESPQLLFGYSLWALIW